MVNIRYSKYNGLGNSYVFFNVFDITVARYLDKIINKIPEISEEFNSDGVILLMPSDKADVKMRIFNADASEAEMCGNGARALVGMAYDSNVVTTLSSTIETNAGILEALNIIDKEEVKLKMFYPPKVSEGIVISNGYEGYKVDIGNPHFVINIDNVDKFAVEKVGRSIENDLENFPEKVNVEFWEEVSPGVVRMRVWERGSGETKACGTGACAVAAVYRQLNDDKYDDVTVQMLGGGLSLSWKNEAFHMQGPIKFENRGGVSLDNLKKVNSHLNEKGYVVPNKINCPGV